MATHQEFLCQGSTTLHILDLNTVLDGYIICYIGIEGSLARYHNVSTADNE
jgi:hypothetical protein